MCIRDSPNTVRDYYLAQMEFTRYNARTITTPEAYMEELEKVRRQGYAMDNEEELSGVVCVGTPIFNYTSYPCGAIWISGPKDRLSKEVIRQSVEYIKDTAQCISCLLYTSDAADDLLCVELGGGSVVIKKKKSNKSCL